MGGSQGAAGWLSETADAETAALGGAGEEDATEGGGVFGVTEKRLEGADEEFGAAADFDEMNAGANSKGGSFFDGHGVQNAAHFHVVRED